MNVCFMRDGKILFFLQLLFKCSSQQQFILIMSYLITILFKIFFLNNLSYLLFNWPNNIQHQHDYFFFKTNETRNSLLCRLTWDFKMRSLNTNLWHKSFSKMDHFKRSFNYKFFFFYIFYSMVVDKLLSSAVNSESPAKFLIHLDYENYCRENSCSHVSNWKNQRKPLDSLVLLTFDELHVRR